jgi:hypothetical protein
MENEITNTGIELDTKLSITTEGTSYLKTTYKWATFLAIMGFIGSGIMVLVAIVLMIISPFLGTTSKLGSTFGVPMFLIGLIYLALGVLYFFPAYYLYNFSDKMKSALYSNRQDELDNSLKNLKKVFKFMGIMTIVLISAYIIMIPVFIFISLTKNMAM